MKWNFKDYNKQKCLDCKLVMKLITDYIMGGSHYYSFKCEHCKKEFNGSTYDFTIREAKPRSDKTYDRFIDTFKHHFR